MSPTPPAKKAVLDAFWRLSDKSANHRVEAAFRILDHAQSLRKQGESAGDEADKSLEYLLTRLVRGLGSSNPSARQGFFVAMVEFLRSAPAEGKGALAEKVLELMEQHLTHFSSKSEAGDFMSGQLFGYGALLRSGAIVAPAKAGEIVESIVELSKKRSYLVLPAFKFIIDHLGQAGDEEVMSHLWPAVRDSLDFGKASLTLEKIWMLLSVSRHCPKALDKKFMVTILGRKKLVTSELCEEVAKCKEETTVPLHIMRRHPGIPVLVEALREERLLEEFWTSHVDPTLAKERATTYKTMLAFLILDLIVDGMEEGGSLEKYLTPNLVSQALSSLSRLESPPEEDKLMLGVFDKMVAKAAEKEELQIPFFKALLTSPGNICFDKLSGGSVVHTLLVSSSIESVKWVANLFRAAVTGKTRLGAPDWSAQERVYAGQQLAKLTGHAALHSDLSWKTDILKFILEATLFESGSTAPFPREAKRSIRGIFFKGADFKNKGLEQTCQLLTDVVDHANSLIAKKTPMAEPLKDVSRKAWDKVIDTIDTLKKLRSKGDRKECTVFQLLFTQMAFQLLEDPVMACEVLEELHQCYGRATQRKSRRKSSATEKEEPHWTEVVLDLLISLQSHSKHVLRSLATSVFKIQCSHAPITTEALHALLDVVCPKEAVKEKGGEDGEDEDEEDEEEWEDMDEDKKDEAAASDEDEEGEAEGEESDEDEEDDGEPSKELRERVKAALGDHAAAGSEDDDEEDGGEMEEEDIDMDDIDEEDMKKMDEALANVFRQLSGKKSGAEKKKERKNAKALVDFRIRCLDLLDVYVTHQPRMAHVLLILQRVILALEASKGDAEKDLRVRLAGTLKKITNLRKEQQFTSATGGDDTESSLSDQLVSFLQFLVDLANGGSLVMAALNNPQPIFSQCGQLVLRMSQIVDDMKLSEDLDAIYVKATQDFFNNTHCLLPVSFFLLPINTKWSGAFQVAEKLAENAFNQKIRMFRRSQALVLLDAFVSNGSLVRQEDKKTLVPSAEKIVGDLLKKVAEELHEGRPSLVGRHLKEMLHLLHDLITKCPDLDFEGVKEAVENFKDRVPTAKHSTEVKKELRKVMVALKIPLEKNTSEKKKKNFKEKGSKKAQENGTENGDGTSQDPPKAKKNKKKKKKKQHNKDSLEEKKRRKEYEIQGQFAGMDMPDFSGLALNDNMNFTPNKADVKEGKPKAKKEKKEKKKRPAPVEEGVQDGNEGSLSPTKSKKKKKKVNANGN